MRRVEAKVDEEGDGHSILEPLHHVGLAVQGVGHVASQDDVLSCTCRYKLGLLSHSVGTWGNSVHGSTNPVSRPTLSRHTRAVYSVKQNNVSISNVKIKLLKLLQLLSHNVI